MSNIANLKQTGPLLDEEKDEINMFGYKRSFGKVLDNLLKDADSMSKSLKGFKEDSCDIILSSKEVVDMKQKQSELGQSEDKDTWYV
jgi:hypothetical protein